jgi:hypothetical protein
MFINTKIKNACAFVMDISSDELEEDCMGVVGSSHMFEYRYITAHTLQKRHTIYKFFRFTGKEGELEMRSLPCYCEACEVEDYDECGNKEYVGEWIYRTINSKGFRQPKARYTEGAKVRNRQTPVEKIAGKCIFEGRTEYLIKYIDSDELTWIPADSLDCFEMMEEYELESSFLTEVEEEEEEGEEEGE